MRSVDTQAERGATGQHRLIPGQRENTGKRNLESGGSAGADTGAASCDNIIISTTITTGGWPGAWRIPGMDWMTIKDLRMKEDMYSLDDRSSPSPIPHFPNVLVSLQIIFTMSLLLRLSPPLDTRPVSLGIIPWYYLTLYPDLFSLLAASLTCLRVRVSRLPLTNCASSHLWCLLRACAVRPPVCGLHSGGSV